VVELRSVRTAEATVPTQALLWLVQGFP